MHASPRFFLTLLAAYAAAAHGAQIDPRVVEQANADGDSDALLVLVDQSVPTLAPLDTNADYRVRRRVLVDALRTRADTTQRELRLWLRRARHRASGFLDRKRH